MKVAAELSVCGDCLQIIANGSHGLDLEPERIAEIESAIAAQAGDVVPAGEDNGFSWQPCQLCESPLGGERYGAALLVAEERPPLDSPDRESWAEAQGELMPRRARTAGARISAREWRQRGGLRNGELYRVQAANGRWRYYLAAQ